MLVKRLKNLVALVFGIAAVVMLRQGGGFIWPGFFSLITGLLVPVKPDGAEKSDRTALADYENLRYGHPSRDTTRSDYLLHGPMGGGGPGDSGAF